MAARDWRVWALKATVAVGRAAGGVAVVALAAGGEPGGVSDPKHGHVGAGGVVGDVDGQPLAAAQRLGGVAACASSVGVIDFAYAVAHFVLYVWLDQGLEAAAIWRDVLKRPFVTAGMAAFMLLLPLAITSTDGWMRRLKRRWGQLHQLVYPAAALAVLHYFWLVKKDLTQPLLYALALAVLLGWRLWRWGRRQR